MDEGVVSGDDSAAEEPAPEVTYLAEAGTDDGTAFWTLGRSMQGETPAEQYATIYNTGTGTLTFGSTMPANFRVDDIVSLEARGICDSSCAAQRFLRQDIMKKPSPIPQTREQVLLS